MSLKDVLNEGKSRKIVVHGVGTSESDAQEDVARAVRRVIIGLGITDLGEVRETLYEVVVKEGRKVGRATAKTYENALSAAASVIGMKPAIQTMMVTVTQEYRLPSAQAREAVRTGRGGGGSYQGSRDVTPLA